MLPKKCFLEAVGETRTQSLTGLVEIPSVPLTSCVTEDELLTLFDLSVLVSKVGILIFASQGAEDEMQWREASARLAHSGAPTPEFSCSLWGGR